MNKAKQTGDNEGMMPLLKWVLKNIVASTTFQTICRSNY